MGTPEPAEVTASPPVRRYWRAYAGILGIALLHLFLVRGYTGLFWADHGRWLHELSRFAGGERPYHDFSFSGPPLALWIIGSVARLTGTTLAAFSATTAAIYLLIILLFLHLLKRLTPDLVFPIALPAVLFATAYACRSGVPLPLGTPIPGVPVGFLCLLGAATATLNTQDRRPAMGHAVLAGVLTGLAMLSRGEFWLPGIYLLAMATVLLGRDRATRQAMVAPAGACGITVIAGMAALAATAGPAGAASMIGSSAHSLLVAIISPPSLERLTVDLAASAAIGLVGVTALWLCLAISDRGAVRWAGVLLCVFLAATATHVGMSVAIARDMVSGGPEPLPTMSQETLWTMMHQGQGALGAAVALFDERFQAHLFPLILLPVVLGVLLIRWRHWLDTTLRNRLLLLLGLALVARIHRAGMGPDWYNVLLELPAYALFFELLCGRERRKAARAIRAALSVLILLGLFTYVSQARGPLSFIGSFDPLATPAGTVRWPPFTSAAWQRADSLVRRADPSGSRPVFAFGATGGWNYFLGRPNPVAETGGLTTGPQPPDSVVQRVLAHQPAVILVDNRFAMRSVPATGTGGGWIRWERTAEPNVFSRSDREYFDRMRERCREVGDPDPTYAIRVFDCAVQDAGRADTAPGTAARRPGSSR